MDFNLWSKIDENLAQQKAMRDAAMEGDEDAKLALAQSQLGMIAGLTPQGQVRNMIPYWRRMRELFQGIRREATQNSHEASALGSVVARGAYTKTLPPDLMDPETVAWLKRASTKYSNDMSTALHFEDEAVSALRAAKRRAKFQSIPGGSE